MKSDEQLMLEYQGGSPMAFEQLFERYRTPVYAFFRRRLNDAARAEELAQETFIVILRGSERYEATARFRTYSTRLHSNSFGRNDGKGSAKQDWRQTRRKTGSRATHPRACGFEALWNNWTRIIARS
jgi:RNA polymerase sigma factor (sigma-70 family)